MQGLDKDVHPYRETMVVRASSTGTEVAPKPGRRVLYHDKGQKLQRSQRAVEPLPGSGCVHPKNCSLPQQGVRGTEGGHGCGHGRALDLSLVCPVRLHTRPLRGDVHTHQSRLRQTPHVCTSLHPMCARHPFPSAGLSLDFHDTPSKLSPAVAVTVI